MIKATEIRKTEIDRLAQSTLSGLFAANEQALRDSQELLQRLSEQQYVMSCNPVFLSTIGAHFRHVLEHYQCFINALEKAAPMQICYDLRCRSMVLEQQPIIALDVLQEILTKLQQYQVELVSDQACYAQDQESFGLVSSSLSRELLFLQAHTIHHHAILAGMCRLHNIVVKENFGVAISTRDFLCQKATTR